MDSTPQAGMAGARLVYGDGRFQHSAFAFPGLSQLLFDLFPLPNRLYESKPTAVTRAASTTPKANPSP